jgi:hypothetical protein
LRSAWSGRRRCPRLPSTFAAGGRMPPPRPPEHRVRVAESSTPRPPAPPQPRTGAGAGERAAQPQSPPVPSSTSAPPHNHAPPVPVVDAATTIEQLRVRSAFEHDVRTFVVPGPLDAFLVHLSIMLSSTPMAEVGRPVGCDQQTRAGDFASTSSTPSPSPHPSTQGQLGGPL